VATTAGDFTIGTTSVYKHDATGSKWVVIDNSDLNNMLNFDARSVSAGASMFNRIEWVTEIGGKVYFTETGRDNPGSRWAGEKAAGAVFAPHHLVRAAEQSLEFGKTISPDSSEYWDYYGRVMMYDPATSQTSVFLEGGPYFTVDPSASSYPDKHLSNPDGLNKTTINGKDYMLINEDLNGTSKGRTPAGISNRTCELFMLDMSIANPTLNDLVRIAVVPVGAEITGAIGTTDGKTILFNVQHPSTSNPFPFNNSLTVAITGWDQVTIGIDEEAFEGKTFEMYPNPATRTLYFRELSDIAIYNVEGKRMNVYRQVQDIDISHLNPGVYYVQNAAGQTQKLLVN
jgi:secreted PhoX family phosphatase